MTMYKKSVPAAIAAVLGVSLTTAASAATVLSIKVMDVGSTLNGVNGGGAPGTYSSTLDGNASGFRFAPINPTTYTAVSAWAGDVGTGTILANGAANSTGSFSTGFVFSGAPFVPYTFGSGINADITGTTLSFTSLDWGGNYGGAANFDLPPDTGTLKVNWAVANTATTTLDDYLVSFQWEHVITDTLSPYYGFNARWIVEGVATVQSSAVPVPAAAWLFGSGIVGLAGVARRRRTRK